MGNLRLPHTGANGNAFLRHHRADNAILVIITLLLFFGLIGCSIGSRLGVFGYAFCPRVGVGG